MLDINLIRHNLDDVRKNLERRKDPEILKRLDEVVKLDGEWRKLKQEADKLRSERNKVNLRINEAKKAGKDASELLKKAKELPLKMKKVEEKEQQLREKIDNELMRIPNMLHDSVPYGESDEDNVEERKWGNPRKFDFDVKSHVEIAEGLGADFDRSIKTSGAGWYFLKGQMAMLSQAIMRLAMDVMIKKGYELVEVPLMMRQKPYEGVTDLADFEDVMYKVEDDDGYLIATSEHPMAAMYMNETMENLPIKLVGFSPCFRKEIGSHGIDTKGFFRRHQFYKIEQFVFCKPEDSWKFFEELLKNAEELFQMLEIPYRITNICTSDIGIVAAKKFDLEAWLPRQKKYAEVVSCSNCTDYQARRLNIKAGKEGGEKKDLHTLNATAIAVSRAMVAILENHQQKDGSVKLPKALAPYMGGIKVLKPG